MADGSKYSARGKDNVTARWVGARAHVRVCVRVRVRVRVRARARVCKLGEGGGGGSRYQPCRASSARLQ
jgi:hypothetical protein